MVQLLNIEESERRCLEAGKALASPPPGEEVVITGCSGRFPNSDNVHELRDNLFSKVDLISDDGRRWNLQHDEIPQRTGKINHVSKFDAAFFGIHYKQAHVMDPLCRILMERAYEAIVDAGVNPRKLRGTSCGVFIGACFSESEKTWFYERMNINGFGILGSSRAMLSNRISYWLGTSGPSYTVDSACSSSLYAVEHAYKAIRDGVCNSAIVGGCNLCLHPYVSLQFSRLGVLSPDGRCKAFDQSANGYCRAEAVTVLFLQKSKDAKRVYATIVHAKTNCDGYKEQGITYPSGQMQRKLLEDFYKECLVDPSNLAYIEAHGTGTKVGDPEECNALDQVFCNGRDRPLLIGSIKSNLGHTEPASGICSIVKVIISMETGKIPPNLWFNEPKDGIPGFIEGRLKVVSEIEDFEGGMVGVNSFGFGGANCHVLMNWNEKEKKNNGAPTDNLPRLINLSGRTEEAVRVLIEDIESRPIDVEHVRLLHDIHSEDIPGHLYRGFIVISSDRKITDVQYFPGKKRPIWLIFSGLGSQWPAMGKALLNIPIFASAIEQCSKALQLKNIDVVKIISSDDPKILDNTVNAVVAVVAVQIGLVDILQSLGIIPDYMIGHSIGELSCSYADGSLTKEQAILAAYYRAIVSVETGFVRGAMAAVGMGYKKIKPLLPPEIEVACHNGPDSCTIVGPHEPLKTFVSDLVVRGVFTKEVPCSSIPYHSRYLVKAGPRLLSYLQKVIPSPKARSSKWISTSVPEAKWNTPIAKLSSAEYHSNNFLSPVLFEEAIKQIPCEAVTIEVAPHGLLQPILRRALNKSITNVALTQRGHADNVQVLLTGIGKLYEVGLEPQLANLYPPVEYPVSRGTPMIAPLVRWDHRDDWFITSYRIQETIKSGERAIRVSLDDEDWTFVSGHVIDGRNLFPATGYIMLAWETLGMMRGEYYTNVPIVFENVKFNRATNIPKGGAVEFTVNIQKGSGAFEVIEGGVAVVTGRLYRPDNVEKESINLPAPVSVESDELLKMSTRDIYKELRLRGYNYAGLFRGLQEIDSLGRVGKVTWVNNWVAFMDNMLQIQIMHEDTRGLYVPTSINKIIIDPSKQVPDDPTAEVPYITVHAYESIEVIKAGGVEIRCLKAQQIPRRKALGEPVLEKYEFTPHYSKTPELDLFSAMRVCLHVALENVQGVKVKVVELGGETVTPDSVLVAPYVISILGDLPLIQAEVTVISPQNNPKAKDLGPGITVDERKLTSEQNCLAVVGSNIVNKVDVIQQAFSVLRDNAFIIARESPTAELQLDDFNVLYDVVIEEERLLLLSKKLEPTSGTKVIKISTEDDFSWVPLLKELVKDEKVPSVLLVSQNEDTNGLIGLVNCVRKEPEGEKVRGIFILDKDAPPFDIELPFYANELKKGLVMNVLKDGQWGSYRHQPLPPVSFVKRMHGYINNTVRGDLSSFKFIEGPFNIKLRTGELKESELITVYYCSINFRDVMLASGKLSSDVVARGRIEQDIVIGFEFAGRTASGRRVMGMAATGAMASVISCDVGLLWDIPDNWTLAEAATVPVVFGTARSSLLLNGRLKKGESVLIHSGTGGVGLAAIMTALEVGAEIYTTVGTKEKREYILETFPQIPASHIGNSRDTSFEHMIKRETNGRGVDLVLNSLAEDKLQASIRCLAKGGRFIEIGKFDIANNNPLGMEMFADDASFHAVMLDMLFSGARERQKELLDLVQEGLKSTSPLKTTIYPVSEVEQAFRYMASGKHIGKVILKLRDEEEDKLALPEPMLYDCIPKFYASATKSYIIAGGLGGFGLELADWLALRGAKNIVLTSRTGLRTGYQSMRIRIWKSYNARVVISTDDISTEEGVTNLLNKANELGPVDGIFNLAVVLKDALIENQSEQDFRVSFAPKAVATTHLDRISRKLCPELEHFVIFSSVSCGRGNAGQTNYGMANSVMERICEKRKAEGLPGLAIQWGAIGEVGLVAEMQEDHVELVIGGTLQQSISSCLQCLDVFLKQDNPIVSSMVVAEKRAAGSGAGNIVDTVIGIMGIKDLKTVSLHSSLAELGMDSMMAVEIKQTLEREFEVFLTAQDIRGLTFAKLAALDANGQGVDESSADKKAAMLIEKNMPEGIGYLLRLVCAEEVAVKPVITMKESNEFSNNPVFLIPGLEGMFTIFSAMVQDLQASAHCLQFPYNRPVKSMQELAQVMLPVLKPLSVSEKPVTLLGYSTGAFAAIEMALLLEQEGRKVNLILVDGAPDFLQMLCKVMNVGETDDEIQNTIVMGVYNVLVPGTNEDVREELKQINKFEDKIYYARGLIPETATPHSVEHQGVLMVDLYHRIKNVLGYKKETDVKIQGRVTLIRPSEQTVGNMLKEDYNLSQYCEKAVDVVFVDGNHLSMLDGPQIAAIVNAIHNEKPVDLVKVAEEFRLDSNKVPIVEDSIAKQFQSDATKAQ